MKPICLIPWLGAAILCMAPLPASAQQMPAQPQPAQIFQYPVTAPDVDPGVDHGNSDTNLPDEFRKQLVLYRSLEPPGTIIVDTQERHLYLIQDQTHALR
jgi:lipoprotein-anchoring transpeptidase ErfK/SrfK